MADSGRKYQFSWDTAIGADMRTARPGLGPLTRVEIYRLFQFTLRDVLEQRYGTGMTDALFKEAGCMAGRAFFERFLKDAQDVPALVNKLQEAFREYGVGIFRVEETSGDGRRFVFTVDEDLDCSGLPDTEDVICVYDEGFIQGVLESFSGTGFDVREVDCWCTGSRTCRFEAKAQPAAP